MMGMRFALVLVFATLLALSYGVDLDQAVKTVHTVTITNEINAVVVPTASAKRQSGLGINSQQTEIWSATSALSAAENAASHFRKHGADFGFVSVDEYVAAATEFLHNPPATAQTKAQDDTDIVRFDADTARFAVMRADGTPRTYYILNPEIHGYPTNQAYFDAQ